MTTRKKKERKKYFHLFKGTTLSVTSTCGMCWSLQQQSLFIPNTILFAKEFQTLMICLTHKFFKGNGYSYIGSALPKIFLPSLSIRIFSEGKKIAPWDEQNVSIPFSLERNLLLAVFNWWAQLSLGFISIGISEPNGMNLPHWHCFFYECLYGMMLKDLRKKKAGNVKAVRAGNLQGCWK